METLPLGSAVVDGAGRAGRIGSVAIPFSGSDGMRTALNVYCVDYPDGTFAWFGIGGVRLATEARTVS